MPDEIVDLIATKDYPYGKIRVSVGQTFTATKRDANLLISTGLATLAPVAPPEPTRRTKTRELKPGPLPPLTPEMTAAAPGTPEAPEPEPPRTYKRRDMQPEE